MLQCGLNYMMVLYSLSQCSRLVGNVPGFWWSNFGVISFIFKCITPDILYCESIVALSGHLTNYCISVGNWKWPYPCVRYWAWHLTNWQDYIVMVQSPRNSRLYTLIITADAECNSGSLSDWRKAGTNTEQEDPWWITNIRPLEPTVSIVKDRYRFCVGVWQPLIKAILTV